MIAADLSVVAFLGGLGEAIRPYSPLVAVVLGLVLPPDPRGRHPGGRYYLRRTDDGIEPPVYDEFGNPSGEHLKCHVCHVCSLRLSTDKVADHVLAAQSSVT